MNNLEICPVCENRSLELGEIIDVGFGPVFGPKGGPDRCEICGYIEQGPHPDDLPFKHYKECWQRGIRGGHEILECKKKNLEPYYSQWIIDNSLKDAYGNCLYYSRLMMRAFPELRLVEGSYFCAIWGLRGHFWLVDEEEYIVDPTAAQFPSKGCGEYAGHLVPKNSLIFQREMIKY